MNPGHRPRPVSPGAVALPVGTGGELHADTIATLIRIHNAAVAKAEKIEARLDDPDLPRGPLPLMNRASGYRTEAFHMLIALEALGHGEAGEMLNQERIAA